MTRSVRFPVNLKNAVQKRHDLGRSEIILTLVDVNWHPQEVHPEIRRKILIVRNLNEIMN